ncbi:hypothetical protein AOA80_10785 [Methanomassiliicoccales archaeon RumEn M1]|nr:hypothetical protein AOA80_10785 [Methanomassiliicoccales archaeon RumEn M1]
MTTMGQPRSRAWPYMDIVSRVLPEYEMRIMSVRSSAQRGRIASLTTKVGALELRAMYSARTSPPMAEPPRPPTTTISASMSRRRLTLSEEVSWDGKDVIWPSMSDLSMLVSAARSSS